MKRDIYQKLLAWKSAKRKPIILRGARQVGKTYILKEFGENEYEALHYFDFESEPELAKFFSGSLKPEEIIRNLSILREQRIEPHQHLIVFDEVQNCPRALTALKYFCDEASEFHIIAAGSLLGIRLGQHASFPVGKVTFFDLYPMTFSEFLKALKKDLLLDYLDKNALEPLPEPFHDELIKLLKEYFFVGGMPEAVRTYLLGKDYGAIRKVQEDINMAYSMDFSKHASPDIAIKLSEVWQSVPRQLARETKKFRYSELKKGARAREYGNVIQWLVDAGLVIKVHNTHTPKLPLSGYCEDAFKLYVLDVGLLGALLKVTAKTILLGDNLYSECNGAFVENFAARELVTHVTDELYYWTSKNTAEVDFLLTLGDKIVPLEVKAGRSKQKKSLRVYQEKYNPELICRSNLLNFKEDSKLRNYPLYGLWCLKKSIHSSH